MKQEELSDREITGGEEQSARCGHNFIPESCPYEVCGYRAARALLRECIPYVEFAFSGKATAKEMVAWLEARPALLARARKELGE